MCAELNESDGLENRKEVRKANDESNESTDEG